SVVAVAGLAALAIPAARCAARTEPAASGGTGTPVADSDGGPAAIGTESPADRPAGTPTGAPAGAPADGPADGPALETASR
ncbi:hypothetical protein ACFV8W_44455, partial [Streptomyces sp. NPDC059786]